MYQGNDFNDQICDESFFDEQPIYNKVEAHTEFSSPKTLTSKKRKKIEVGTFNNSSTPVAHYFGDLSNLNLDVNDNFPKIYEDLADDSFK